MRSNHDQGQKLGSVLSIVRNWLFCFVLFFGPFDLNLVCGLSVIQFIAIESAVDPPDEGEGYHMGRGYSWKLYGRSLVRLTLRKPGLVLSLGKSR